MSNGPHQLTGTITNVFMLLKVLLKRVNDNLVLHSVAIKNLTYSLGAKLEDMAQRVTEHARAEATERILGGYV